MGKVGRPKRSFSDKDINQIKVLARCHCPDSEIAAFMECGEKTIQRHFGPLVKEMREAGKANIRAKQFELAMKGDKTMLIWVGKQILGQRDRFNQEIIQPPIAVTEEGKKEFSELREMIIDMNRPKSKKKETKKDGLLK